VWEHVETVRFSFEKVHVASQDAAIGGVGRLALCRTWRHFTSSEYEFGWSVFRDSNAKELGFRGQSGISNWGGTDQGWRCCHARRARWWTGTEVHRGDWWRPLTSSQFDEQASPIVLI